MMAHIIRLNEKIQKGSNRVSWVQSTLAGSSVVGILLHYIMPATAAPGTVTVFGCSALGYYLIEKAHEKHGKDDKRDKHV